MIDYTPLYPTNSMTAFARVQGSHDIGDFVWELRSVNHRYVEVQFKLPEKFKSIEPVLRERIRQAVARGKVECHLHFKPSEAEQSFVINQAKVDALLLAAQSLKDKDNRLELLSSHQILQWPGVLQVSEMNIELITEALLLSFNQALAQLTEARHSEGQRMAATIINRLDLIDELVADIKKTLPSILAEHQKRLEEKLASLAIEVDQERVAQEVVMLAQKVDIAEEIDRLIAHTDEVRATLAKTEPCGRRLDFLMQELNREANTLGSKSIATQSTQGAVNLKVLIEQMREQVQNIE
ncbi:MAG: YicC/YloC family endoribonuclease [Pseudomonadota bacterium]|nr:YicC/YloC family endoribonuclease [Pseudomonadota bacterium]